MKRSAPRLLSVVVALGGVALATGLSVVASVVNAHSNERLLVQQVREAAATLAGQVPVVQSQLVDAAQVAADTDADPQIFDRFAKPKISATGPFASISLWRLSGGVATRIALVGASTELELQGRAQAFFAAMRPSTLLHVTGILSGSAPAAISAPRLGYAEMPADDTSGLVVYAERFLPASRHIEVPSSSPFGALKFAVYLGSKPVKSQLLEASAPVPVGSHSASASVPFGDVVITLVGAAKTDLAGGLSARLEWIVLGAGCAVALASGATVEYVSRRRMLAETLAAENRRLYVQQRDIAGTLQHALLPDLPSGGDVEVAARYLPGVAGTEVGGDWYDVIRTDADRLVFVVGDVSGRGLRAAAVMASLRFAVRAYLMQGDDIDVVLTKLDDLLDAELDHQFATALVGELDVASRRLRLCSAGHYLPLLLTTEGARFVDGHVESPVGVKSEVRPQVLSVDIPDDATLLAFTDGLVERRGEILDIGLERLRSAVSDAAEPLDTLLDALLAAVVPTECSDDVVVLAMRWGERKPAAVGRVATVAEANS